MFEIDALQAGLAIGGLLVAGCFVALIALRWITELRAKRVLDAVRLLEPMIHNWLVLDGEIGSVRLALRKMPASVALRSLTRLAAQQTTLESQQALARELRSEPWVGEILRNSNSIFWWRRFDSVRLLSVVGVPTDQHEIARFLQDRNPAVRLVAMDAAARLPGRPLVDIELETLPFRQDAVQAYQMSALARHPAIVSDALIPRLSEETPVVQLTAWIDVAGAIANTSALMHVRALASHPRPEVRLHVARALRRLADPDTPAVLITLLQDSDWRVRAQAARALGALRCGEAGEELALAVRDRSWWVRYRSALALAQIGGSARDALSKLAQCDDAMARDMSQLVASLTSAAVVEMSEV